MSFKDKNEGFTLIELLMTTMLFSWGIIAVIGFILYTLKQSAPLSYEVTASYLTQEAFEVVRRIRDENYLIRYHEDTEVQNSYQLWHDGLLENECPATGPTEDCPPDCNDPEDDPDCHYLEVIEDETSGSVYYDSDELGDNQDKFLLLNDEGFFNYSAGEESDFQREVRLELRERVFEDGDTEEYLLITVEINWQERGEWQDPKITQTKLYDWYE